MKNSILSTLFFLGAILTTNAQMIALNRNGATQVFKGNTAFVSAYNASQAGDTLYFSGGTFFPPSTINKKLTLFGAGHYLDSSMVTGKTIISGNIALSNGANDFYFEGFQVSGEFKVESNHSITGLSIKRSYITNVIKFEGNHSNPSSNIAIIGSVISGGNFENADNVFISNNILAGAYSNINGAVLNNNVIMASISYYTYLFNNSSNNYFRNNIIRSESYGSQILIGDGNTFYNNVFSFSSTYLGTNPTTLNNQINVDFNSLFVNQTGVVFNYSHNYQLQNPTTYLGVDGTQVGIYGGAFPYKSSAVPKNPHFQINATSPTTNNNGELPVNITVKAQKDQD